MSLNEKQKAFCEYYASTFNATESAIKAGYSKKTAYSIGSENLKKPEIKSYIEQLTKSTKSVRIATIDEVMSYLSNTMRNAEEATRERTKAALILSEILCKSNDNPTGNGEMKIIVETQIKDLSKNKGGNDGDDTI